MRLPHVLIGALAFGIAAANAVEPPRNGAYVSLTTTSATTCARACADDGICIAWAFRSENSCELSAVVPASAPDGALASGFSSRAPAFAPRLPPAPTVEEAVAAAEATRGQTADIDLDLILLGGPEEGDLRLRMSGRN